MTGSCKGIMAVLAVFFSCTLLFAQQPEDNQKETEKAKVSEEKAVQDKQKKDRAYTAGEILIVRDRIVKPGTVSVIDGESVKNSTKTDVTNLVAQKVPSFNTGNNRVMGFGVASSGAAAMSIRGIGVSSWDPRSATGPTTGVPILINGMDAGMMINNHPVADIFSMKNINRIEVLHGPQPVLYGGGAMGGIINVITKRREEDGYDTELSASYGSWNTTEDYIMHYGKRGAFDYGVSYNFRYTDGAREQSILGTEFDSRYMSNNGTMHVGYQVNENWYAGIDGYLMGLDIHDPGAAGFPDDDLEYFNILRGGTVVQIGNSYDKLEGSIQLYGNWGRHKSYLPADNDQDAYSSFDQMLGLKAKEMLELDSGTTITGGAEYRRYGGKSKNQATGYVYTDDKYIQEGSLYGLVEQSLFENFWILSAGGRYTYNSKFGSYGAWQAGTVVNPHKNTKLLFQSAQGFKVPDIIQYFNKWMPGDTTIDESGTDLKPETYISIEAGVEQRLLDSLTMSLTGYRIYSDNKFTKVVVGVGVTEWTNADPFNYNGVEATLEYKPLEVLSLSAGYSFIDIDQKGRYLPYVPKHKLLSGIRFEDFGFMVNLEGQFVLDTYANEGERVVGLATIPLHKLDDYFVLNMKIAYSFLKHYRVFLDLNNITNKEYSTYAVYEMPPTNEFFDYPMPGFNWRAGVSAAF